MDHGDRWDAAQEGAELLREGDTESAAEELERLVTRQPDNEYAYFFLGVARYELGEYGAALRAYVRALELAPRYLGAMIHLGHALRMIGRHDEAIRLARQVMAQSPDDPDAFHLLGLAHLGRGDRAAAVGYLEQFLLTCPEAEAALEVEGLLETLRNNVIPLRPAWRARPN